ncbi:hypothetical protein ACLOJK_012727 [Asimina triloba]
MSHCQTPADRPCLATHAAAAVGGLSSFCSTKEDRDHAFAVCLQKEASYLLVHGYARHLCSSGLIYARFKAVQLIIQTQCRLNLSIGSVFDAVNYLDRYISANCCLNWEYRKFELLSIACLSIASKYNEVYTPSLIEFQVGPNASSRLFFTYVGVLSSALYTTLRCIQAASPANVVVVVAVAEGRRSGPFVPVGRDPADGINGAEGVGLAPWLRDRLFLRGLDDVAPPTPQPADPRRSNSAHDGASPQIPLRYVNHDSLHNTTNISQ